MLCEFKFNRIVQHRWSCTDLLFFNLGFEQFFKLITNLTTHEIDELSQQ